MSEKTESSIGGKVLGLFWSKKGDSSSDEDETPPAPAAKSATHVPTRIGAASPAPSIGIVGLPPRAAPAVDPQIQAQLQKAMLSDGDNSVGRLQAAMQGLADDVPDPAKCLRAALKTLKSEGLTAEMVLADIASDERILTGKENEFKAYVAAERKKRLGAKQAELDAAQDAVAEKKRQIEALQREIADAEARHQALQTETAADESQFADVEARFAATLAAIRAERATLKSNVQPFATTTKGA